MEQLVGFCSACAPSMLLMVQNELLIGGRYRLVAKLGEGSFGVVYKGEPCCHQLLHGGHPLTASVGISVDTREDVAIKFEHVWINPSILAGEIEIYRQLRGGCGVPEIYWVGLECQYNVMVFELLGPNLEDLFNYCQRKFSLKTVLLIADQLLHRLQILHAKSIIHRDIKPENFLMGRGRRANNIYAVDLGLARRGNPNTSRKSASLIGTARYASINGHLGNGEQAMNCVPHWTDRVWQNSRPLMTWSRLVT